MSTIPRRLLRQDIYEAVLAQVVEGVLAPGSRVRDTAIAEQLGVSRTPVREALVRLAQDGFLDADAGRGFRVRRLDSREVQEIYPIVAALECAALEMSLPLPEPTLEKLKSLNLAIAETRDDPIRRLHLDEDWHKELLSRCNNHRLLSLLAGLKQRIRVYEYDYWRNAGLAETSTREHTGIAEALSRNDVKSATLMLRRNFTRSAERIVQWLEGPLPDGGVTP
jgi:DNA-binding GntR family transcriptional regulator